MKIQVFLFLILNFINLMFGDLSSVNKKPLNLKLNTTNNIIIKGTIDNELSSNFIYELSKIENKKNLLVYLNTPGGSIHDGMQIVAQIKKYKLSCVAENAYSMGFVIFQACKNRYIMSHSILMQHQLSYGVRNEKYKIDSYVSFVNSLEDQLVDIQSKRLGLMPDDFKLKTMNEWWIYGENILLEKSGDRLVELECSVTLTKQNYTKQVGQYEYTYSKCPLIDHHIFKNKTKNYEERFIFTF